VRAAVYLGAGRLAETLTLMRRQEW